MNCCVNDIGTFSHNEEIDTAITLTDLGIYKIFFTSASGNTFVLTKDIESVDTLKMAIGELNENMVYNFKVMKPDGTMLLVDACDNFKLKTIINTQIDGCDDLCNPSTYSGPYS